ncbi:MULTISPECIES: DUF4394 domain-containing protein [unclassified Micromonospora]|uniref:DUF4394 domain-containing protein n=1 Tax=unclassified Micromonospora TaxID=2617518 RepID=UPI001C5F8F88|nr:DUF4394 domain-containing protein [Micromonospora sp. RL09-050-HVF-A]MBW4701012.1 DUF4394 domain-containing protein [Micromonospora sp. RL09-050-HVF-A]
MRHLLHRGLLTGVAVVVGLSAIPAPAAAVPAGPSSGAASAGRPSLAAGTCSILWDLLNLGGRNGLVGVGLTGDQQLVKFAANRPNLTCTIGTVDLPGAETLVGIDYRVQDGRLYGVGDAGGIYTLSTRDATATQVSQLTVALSGTYFGVDFNPAADRLRIISDTGQNLRHNVNFGGTTLVDGTLTFPPAVGTALGVTGAAYTNNDLNPNTATTLFDIDTTGDQVAVQSPANSGQLAATGKLGVDADQRAGFDIYSTIRGGRAVGNTGYAVLNGTGPSRLYAIDPLTGEASTTGAFAQVVVDLALQLKQP